MQARSQHGSLASTLALGVAAGVAGTWLLDRVDWFLYERQSDEAKAKTREARPHGLDPAHNIVRMASEAMGRDDRGQPDYPKPTPEGLATHYALGVGFATLYAALRQRLPWLKSGGGALFGAGLWAAQDEGFNTLTGLGGDPRDYPWEAHARGLAAHVVYGMALEMMLGASDTVAAAQSVHASTRNEGRRRMNGNGSGRRQYHRGEDRRGRARKLAVVTGASSGIGYELAKIAARDDYDLVLAADDRTLQHVADELRAYGGQVVTVLTDLSTDHGVEELYRAIRRMNRPVDALFANAGRGLGRGFLEQDFQSVLKVINTNVTGTIDLIQRVARDMRARGEGKILITGSIAGLMPGAYQAVYNGTKAFIDSFSFALREELRDTGVTVSCLMPGPTDTEFFDRAGMNNTKVGRGKKQDPAQVARAGYEAMMDDEGSVIAGSQNKMQAALLRVMPDNLKAKQHRRMAEPR